MGDQQLALLRSSFLRAAQEYPELHLAVFEWPEQKPIDHISWFGHLGQILRSLQIGLGGQPSRLLDIRLFGPNGDTSGAEHFLLLAQAAGEACKDHALFCNWGHFGHVFSAGAWVNALFALARQDLAGSILRRRFVGRTNPPNGDTCTSLEGLSLDAFTASVVLIDELLTAPLSPTDTRNKCCYDEWQAGKTLKEIWTITKQHPEWEQLGDAKSVRGPINAWAKKHTPPLPVRQGQPGKRRSAT